MKKLLMVILMASIVSPAFAFADNNKSENDGEKEIRSTSAMVQVGQMDENDNEEDMDDEDMDDYKGFTTSTSTSTTTVDMVAPIITLATASALTSTSATISWTTNELANGNIYVSTVSPVVLATATTLGTTTLSMTHSFNLASLTPSTTYYYVVKSADASNNVSTSAQMSFVTPATVLSIANLAASNIASTTATVSWTTNIPAVSSLYYGTSTPPTSTVSTTTLKTSHSFSLIGLFANTTYNFIAQAIDVANNIVLSLTTSFTTTQ